MTETITLPRRLRGAAGPIEDAEDAAAVAAFRAREEALGKETARADFLAAELVTRLVEGEHPIRIWREHRKMTARDLCDAAGLPPSYLSTIESGKKPGSVNALVKISRALDVTVEDLARID